LSSGFEYLNNSPGNQSANQPVNQPTNQPISQPTSQPTNQPINQPISQPTNQSTNQLTNQPRNQLHTAVILKKLTISQLNKKFPTFYGTQKFISFSFRVLTQKCL
jgi:uncharacterized membrane protein